MCAVCKSTNSAHGHSVTESRNNLIFVASLRCTKGIWWVLDYICALHLSSASVRFLMYLENVLKCRARRD